jgi:putative oxidoreductase
MDTGILIARIVFGLLMMGHGAQKLFGWFGGYGLSGVSGFFETLGFKPVRPFALAASVGELMSGALITAGLFGPVGPAMLLSIMIVAAVTVHWGHGVFAATNGIELPLLYATAAVAFALSGYGRYSLDAMLGWSTIWTPTLATALLVAGVAAGILNLLMRHRPATAQ